MSVDELTFSGINAATGEYLHPPISFAQAASLSKTEQRDREYDRELEYRYQQTSQKHFSMLTGVDPLNLAEAGWGVIIAQDDPEAEAILKALEPLLEWRRAQAEKHFRKFTGPHAYRTGESNRDFLGRHGVGIGPADPAKGVPYYLLLVGSPMHIPYRFQYQLQGQVAVGRIHFDTPEEYARYARSVVTAEERGVRSSRRLAFFGPKHPGDIFTEFTASHLVEPLAGRLSAEIGWDVQFLQGDQATKGNLSHLLRNLQPPALLFTAGHSVGFPIENPRTYMHQGALLCAEWPGPQDWNEAIPEEFYVSADDLDESTNVAGLISFHVASYTAGTPGPYDFPHHSLLENPVVSAGAFVAPLARRLLSHPEGGALAVVGQLDQLWGYSFLSSRQAYEQTAVLESTLKRILAGSPVGFAMEFIYERHAELATELARLQEERRFGSFVDPRQIAEVWTSLNDARSTVIIGDPAVRLPGVTPRR